MKPAETILIAFGAIVIFALTFGFIMAIGAAAFAALAALVNYCFGTAVSVKGAAIFGAFFILLRPFIFGFKARSGNKKKRLPRR